MYLGIDHLVLAVPDPDVAAAGLEQALGLAATGGGRHDRSGTRNRLVFLGDSYLELIGVEDPALAVGPIGAAVVGALEAGAPGLVTVALATQDLGAVVERLRRAGSPISDAVPGDRVRPDGQVVRWLVAFPPRLGPAEPPFLIEHELAGPEWGDEARAARAVQLHPFGGRARLVGLELAVADPVAVAVAWGVAAGVAFGPGPGPDPLDREARVGEQSIRLVPPTPGDPPARIGILGVDGGREHVLVERFGCRFVRV